MRLSTLIIPTLIAFGFSGCGFEESINKLQQSTIEASKGTKHIRFIELNDLHAHLMPHKELVRENNTTHIEIRGGIAKIATRINALRSESNSTVLMNIGDTFHGGVEATFSLGNAIVDSVNALHVDIGVIGNWDFAYSPAVTKLRFTDEKPLDFMVKKSIGDYEVKAVNYEVIAANWFKKSFGGNDEYMVKPTKVITKEGVKIGFIGLTSDIVEHMHKGFALGMSFTHGKQNYIDIINSFSTSLKNEGCKVIVVMSELGIHKDVALANSIDSGVDIFFSAHTHELTKEPIVSKSGALVVESGNDTYLGVMDVAINSYEQKEFKWQVETITNDIEDDPTVAAIVTKDRAPFLAEDVNIKNPLLLSDTTLTEPIDTIVGYSSIDLNRRGLLDNSFNTAFSDLLMQETHSQLAITPGFRFDAVIDAESDYNAQGEISVEDVYRFFPSPYTLSTANIDGKRLKEIYSDMLEAVVSKDHFEQSGGWVEKIGGLDIVVDIDKNGSERIERMQLKSDGSDINDNTTYSITGCTRPLDDDDILCSYSGFSSKEAVINPQTSSPYSVSDFFMDALKNNLFMPTKHSDVQDLSEYNPNDGFIQPLWE